MTRAFNNPVPPALTPQLQARRDDWVRRVAALVEQVEQWSREAGWQVEIGREAIEEEHLGSYEAPAARVELSPGDLPRRAVLVIPIASRTSGGNGRVDIEGYPTLSRVRLIGADNDGWIIMTDSNVPLRLPWNAQTFRQLAHDLVA
jgi:hypothetical protein